jgi:hypothetical protein
VKYFNTALQGNEVEKRVESEGGLMNADCKCLANTAVNHHQPMFKNSFIFSLLACNII